MYNRNPELAAGVLGAENCIAAQPQQESIKARAFNCAQSVSELNQRMRRLAQRAGVDLAEKTDGANSAVPTDPTLAKIVIDIDQMLNEAHRLADRLEIIA